MVPPDDRAKRLPALSWTSVVDADAGTDAGTDGDGDVTTVEPAADVPAPSPTAPLVSPEIAVAPVATGVETARSEPPPVVLAPMTLSIGDPATPSRSAPIVFEPMTIAPTASAPAPTADEPAVQIRTFAPAPIVPVLADEVGTVRPASTPIDPLPEIREATPAHVDEIEPEIAELIDVGDGATEASASAAAPTAAPATTIAASAATTTSTTTSSTTSSTTSAVTAAFAPALPKVAQPEQRHAAPASVEAAPVATTVAPTSATRRGRSARTRRRGARRGVKLVVTLVIIGALVGAAVVFGRPLLFPADWDATTEPYALAVESSRQVEFAEPLEIVPGPDADVAARTVTEALGDGWEADVAMWRAFGLAGGAVTVDQVAAVLGPLTPAVYSTADGQVHLADGAAAGAETDAAITRAMAAAALDQDHVWSAEQPQRTLDGAVTTTAEVARQAAAVQASSTFDGTPAGPDLASFDALPSIVTYRLLAPTVFAEFEAGAPDDANALDGLGVDGPGPLPTTPPGAAPEAVTVDGDVLVGTPVPMDRSFWYLAFASQLDGPAASAASEAIVDSAVVTADRGGTTCAYATFAGTGVEATDTLRGALQRWVADAPAEFAASFSVLTDGTLQLATCDPGTGFASPVRPTAARELLAMRTAELATWEAIRATDTVDPAADYAFAWPFVAGSSTVGELTGLDGATTPAEFADAARASIERTLTPSG